MKVGRNDPCPCGSGKKYKKCHGLNGDPATGSYVHPLAGTKFTKTGNLLSLFDRNTTLVNGLVDIFGMASDDGWSGVKRRISRDHVKELYNLIAWLWPPDSNIADLLPRPDGTLRAFYMGLMRPESVRSNVVRYSLYCDQILVTIPFLNPWNIAAEYNPLVHPEKYIGDSLKWVLFVMNLAPWIMSGQVILIPDPGDFDQSLRRKTWSLAKERVKEMGIKPGDIKDDDWEKYAEADFKRSWLATPTSAMTEKLKEYDPKMSDDQISQMLDYIEKEKEKDPLFPTNPNEQGMFGIHTSPTGANLEMGTYISQLTGSYLYTDLQMRWKEIQSIEHGIESQNIWGPITKAFQSLQFKFLNENVNVQFANQLRSDGRLESMRNFLRKTWKSVLSASDNPTDVKNDQIQEMRDRLVEEYHKAETEWKKIDSDLLKWVTGVGAAGLLTGTMNWEISTLGFSIHAIGQLLAAKYKRDRFRINTPLSVFVDLRNKK